MIKNIFVFIVLIIFVSAAAWLLFKKGESVGQEANLLSPSPTGSATTSAGSAGKVTTMSNGLQIQDIVVGTGKEAKAGDAISVHYVGTLENGQKFDSSYDRNQPALFTVGVGSLIKGWDQGIPGMKVGGKRRLVVPSDLGYGAQGNGPIPPNATLVFEVELLDVLAAPK